jgi:hypothetical protein
VHQIFRTQGIFVRVEKFSLTCADKPHPLEHASGPPALNKGRHLGHGRILQRLLEMLLHLQTSYQGKVISW